MLRLVISDDRGAKTIVPLVRDEITVGRAENNTIRLTERNVSRSHAQLRIENGVCSIKDAGSYCGVTVNGTQITAESEVKIGDRIGIGDYILTLEVEPEGVRDATQPGLKKKAAGDEVVVSPLPARLVMISEPNPGAEFSMKTDGVVRIGRAEELDVPINHRSVSREHAEVKAAEDGFRIVDLGSINGITINGAKTTEKVLQSGDIIELGEVFFRFVAQGENYQFDPKEAAAHVHSFNRLLRKNFWVITGATAATTAIVIGVLWYSSRDTTAITAVSIEKPQATAPLQLQQVNKWVQACRTAIVGERFAEAIAHASKALAVAPNDKTAIQCKRVASRYYEQEQIFVRGKAQLESGDVEGAYSEFEHLDKKSPFWLRPEVKKTSEELARIRVDLATAVLSNDRGRAGRLAASVLKMRSVSPELRAAALEIQEKARREEPSAPVVASVDRKPQRAPSAAATAAKSSKTRAKPFVELSAAAPTTTSAAKSSARATPASHVSPFQVARACLARGDNPCIVRALEGKAQTAEELGLLIETYRSLGNNKEALRNMGYYLDRFPGGTRANTYRRILKQNSR